MNWFYSENIQGDQIYLDQDESRHCLKTMRNRIGDSIVVFDGKGNIYACQIEETSRAQTRLSVSKTNFVHPPKPALIIAIAPTKNMSRFEWFLEKATELGIQKIYPILCQHSERKTIKLDRLKKILISAAKQSQHEWITELFPIMKFDKFVDLMESQKSKYIASFQPENPNVQNVLKKGNDTVICIGPEGDFTNEELLLAKNEGFLSVNLGNFRLRTETAAIHCVSVFHTLNGLNDFAISQNHEID